VCIPEGSSLAPDIVPHGLHFGSIDTAVDDLRHAGGNTIAVAGGDRLRTKAIREISWKLASGVEHLVLSPNLIDIAGPRIHTRPVSGLSLIHVETPRYAGTRRFLKETLDVLGALLFLVLSSPLLLAAALAVRLSTPGPIFFYQERIGLNGKPFKMLKFRSMVMDAEAQLDTLAVDSNGAGNEIMFKLANDPRITPVGRWLRRFSIDELPQFFNVLLGDMSLVGPRPPLQSEVENYAEDVHRRFLVRPGITGLWQVSGRSNLSWDDSVRLDLYYVENWSVLGDLQILWRTARAVLGRNGAY
jgi:exopolysaccharide biosynthesis polyprenyl glycosylphosphotransferase